MIKKKFVDNDEINLTKIILYIGDNIWKVMSITVVTVIVVTIYYYSELHTKYSPSYVASTEIEPITKKDLLEYERYNLFLKQYDFNRSRKMSVEELELRLTEKTNLLPETQNRIDKKYLFELFLDNIRDSVIILDQIKKYNFINKENYEDDKLYEDDIKRLVSSIRLIPPKLNEKDEAVTKWKIEFQTRNKEEWQNFIKNIDKHINKDIQQYVKNTYEKFLLLQKEFKKYRLEDIDQKISDSLKEYENQIDLRLSLLKEQAEISRELKLDKSDLLEKKATNTIESKIPSYLIGYKMIEKEMELIENRKNKENFILELNELKKKKANLLSNRNVERLEMFLKETPIFNDKKFIAGRILHLSTIFRTNKDKTPSLPKLILLATIMGLVLGIIYTLIENVFKFRRQI